MPPPEPALVPASAPAPAPFNPNGQEEFPKPTRASGWQFAGGADRAVNRPTWGNTNPPQQHLSTMVGVTRHHLPRKTVLTAILIRVSNHNFELKARTLDEVTSTIPGEGVTNTSPSPLTREDVTLAMTMHATYVKSNGIKMVSPLLKLGLSNHTFVFMCVLLPLEL